MKTLMPQKKSFSVGQKALVLVFWLLVWMLISRSINKTLLFPSPFQTAEALFELVKTGFFWQTVAFTMLRVMMGFALAALTGVLFAFLCAFIPLLSILLEPIHKVLGALPVASVIILILLWTNRNAVPVIVSFLAVTAPVWTVVEQGLIETDRQLIEMTNMFRVSFLKQLKCLYLPSVKPYVLSAWSGNLGIAWKACVAAEVIARPALSIGNQLQEAKMYMETADLFAWTVVVVLLSFAFEKVLRAVFSRINNKESK